MSTQPGTVVHTIVGDCGVEQSRIYCLINNLSKAEFDFATIAQYVGIVIAGWVVLLVVMALLTRLFTKKKPKKKVEHME